MHLFLFIYLFSVRTEIKRASNCLTRKTLGTNTSIITPLVFVFVSCSLDWSPIVQQGVSAALFSSWLCWGSAKIKRVNHPPSLPPSLSLSLCPSISHSKSLSLPLSGSVSFLSLSLCITESERWFAMKWPNYIGCDHVLEHQCVCVCVCERERVLPYYLSRPGLMCLLYGLLPHRQDQAQINVCLRVVVRAHCLCLCARVSVWLCPYVLVPVDQTPFCTQVSG